MEIRDLIQNLIDLIFVNKVIWDVKIRIGKKEFDIAKVDYDMETQEVYIEVE